MCVLRGKSRPFYSIAPGQVKHKGRSGSIPNPPDISQTAAPSRLLPF
ncbi:MAG: hypothetical protein MZV64_52715 [Ignavibacteriales bacterium]|nr:hypothetical protein [Ignavibacteriales bacterium]